MLNVPICLTLFRIILIPVMVIVYYLPWQFAHFAAAAIYIVASLTDWLDGWLARKLDQSTPFGAFLDPVADKLMVVCALAILIEDFGNVWFTLPAMIIIGREILISALREWMAELGKSGVVQVSAAGKLKTTLQMIAIIVLLANGPLLPEILAWLGYLLFAVAAILTLWSMIAYLHAAWKAFGPEGNLV